MTRPRSSRRKPYRRFTPETVRWLRQGLNLTQGQFATLMHVSRRTIIRWEQGQHLPPGNHNNTRRMKFFYLWTKYERWLTRGHNP